MYLIIIFVGLVLVILGGICLSAWCCRGEAIDFACRSLRVANSLAVQASLRILCAAHATYARAAVDLVRYPIICINIPSLIVPFQHVWSALVVVSAPRASSRCDTAAMRGPNSTLGSLTTIHEPSRTSLLRKLSDIPCIFDSQSRLVTDLDFLLHLSSGCSWIELSLW